MQIRIEKKVALRYIPVKILLGFLIFTEILVWIGPIEYDINTSLLLPYLIILNMSLWYGYKRGVQNFRPSKYNLSNATLKTIIVFGLVLSIASLIGRWTNHGISISLDSLVSSLSNPGEAYYSKSEVEVETDYFQMLLTPVSWAAIPFGIFAWPKLPKIFRYVVVVTIFVEIFSWFGIGTRKGLFDMILVVFSCWAASYSKLFNKKSFRNGFRIILILLIIAFLFYFIYSNLSRGGDDGFGDLAYTNTSYMFIKSSYVDAIGLPATVAFSLMVNYLCQGYFALSKGLSMGILTPAVMGSSWFTIAIAKKFDYDPTPFTYTKLLEADGIDMSVNWHTLYLWLANDFTFIGVPFIMLLIGYYFAKTWCDCLAKSNPLAYPLMALFVIMVFYAFANNQVFSFSFIPFLFWFIFYIVCSKPIK